MNAAVSQSTIAMLAKARAYAKSGPFGHVINGDKAAANGPCLDVVNPATGEVIAQIARGGAPEVDRAVAAAKAAFPGWRALAPAGRAQVLFAVATAVDAHSQDLIALECLNTGKPLSVATPEIGMIGDIFRFHAGAARATMSPSPDEYAPGYLSILRREPVGVVGAVTPWNYPLLTAVFKLAGALAAGNTVVLKPAELTPLTALRFMEIVQDILPPGVVNLLLGTGPEVGNAMSCHPGIDLMSLTGSVGSGIAVMAAASKLLKPTHLELGGKAPVVVFSDANLATVAQTVRTAGFWNSGQECGAATRILAHRSVMADLTAALVAEAGTIKVGGPESSDDAEMGPLISARQMDSVDAIVDRARNGGAQIMLGGERVGDQGYFFAPTVIAGALSGSEITSQEIFGPVITVEAFDDEADAVSQANAVEYGLSASVWTENVGRALRVSSALNFGTVWVNSHLVLATEMPWGGYGKSGHGRELSLLALDDFSRTKHVMIATGVSE